jgi:hypothetical protein
MVRIKQPGLSQQFKVAACVTETASRVHIAFASACPSFITLGSLIVIGPT